MAAEFRPDIVLLDSGLRGLDGYEIARRLRAVKTDRPLRIVAITGWCHETARAKSLEAGFDVHVVKPVDANLLTRVLSGSATLH
jgi:DNA-binding response OmpR family regulator